MTLCDPCAAGQCMDYHCAMYGCRKRQNHHMAIIPQPQGCICPPTSEQTCQNDRCPRKTWKGLSLIPTPTPKETDNG